MAWIPLTVWWVTVEWQNIGLLGDQNSWFWKNVNCLKQRITRLPWKPLHVQPHPVSGWWNHLITGSFCSWIPLGDLPSLCPLGYMLVALGNMKVFLESEFLLSTLPARYYGFEHGWVLGALQCWALYKLHRVAWQSILEMLGSFGVAL